MILELIDQTATGLREQTRTLTRIFRADTGRGDGSWLIRVTVHKDDHERQSHAAAEVLSDLRTWTTLVTAPASSWHADTPATYSAIVTTAALGPVADKLAARAERVLEATLTPERIPS